MRIALAHPSYLLALGCVALLLSACSQRATKQPASAKDKGPFAGMTAEQRAAIEKELAEGPVEDRMKPDMRAGLERLFGPVLPQVPYRTMRPFFTEKVGEFSMGFVGVNDALGLPGITGLYVREDEIDTDERLLGAVMLEIQDERQVQGGYRAYIEQQLAKIRKPPSRETVKVHGFTGEVMRTGDFNVRLQLKVGRFQVGISMNGKPDLNVMRQFAEALDLEKLSKTN